MGENNTIFWDFDGTLAYREGGWSGALLEALEKEGIEHSFRRDDFKPYLSRGFPWHNPEKSHLHLSTAEKWWAAIKEIFIEAYTGLGISQDKAEKLAGLARISYVEPQSFRLYDDTIKTLRRLEKQNWKHVILSNHVPELHQIIRGLGLESYLTGCISSAEAGFEKPHPEIFRIALLKANHPSQAWMVGDNIKADIKGANQSGIPAILVHKKSREEVKYQADSLSAAARIIEENSEIEF